MAARGAGRATTEANSRPHSDNAGPLSAAPDVRLFIGLNQAPSYDDVTGSHRPIFSPAPAPRQGHFGLFCLITTLLDHEFAPAVELAEAYAQRWEIELSFDEIEIHQTGGERVLRSRTPELVKQEIWSLLLVHYAIRHVMKDAADTVGTDPDELSFMRSYRAIRRQVPNQAGFSP